MRVKSMNEVKTLSPSASGQARSCPTEDVALVILAGGLATRMGGGDKGLRRLAGRPLLSHILERMQGQTAAVVLNANGDSARFDDFGLPVIADTVAGNAGPLAGIAAGMQWARDHGFAWALTVPSDAPFLPPDLLRRLWEAREMAGTPLACASSGGWFHPVIGLWRVDLLDDLMKALREEGLRKIRVWSERHGVAVADWPVEPVDPFFNANRPEDLKKAEQMLARLT